MTTTEPQKYARSLHAPISLGTTSDDRFMRAAFFHILPHCRNWFNRKIRWAKQLLCCARPLCP